MQTSKDLNHYASLEPEHVFKELNSSITGLPEHEVKSRIKQFGKNVFVEKKELNIVFEFLSYFWSPLLIILMVAAAISAYFGEVTNAIIIGVMIFLSAVLDFYEEHTAGKAVEKLKESVKTTATVIRDGNKVEVKIHDICVGDIIFLSAGDIVPADARIISANDFFVNQSALTGESFPKEKFASRVHSKNPSIDELDNIVFSGTSVVTGSATAIVVMIGQNTEFGKIAAKLAKPADKSEFELGITNFGYLIMKIILFLVLFIFLFNSIVKHKILESFMFAVAIAVGLTPELLPMIMSITMAKVSLDMSKKGVIVKKLASIPNFGSMDVLCTDKTGTLTEGKIKLIEYSDVSGKKSENVLLHAYLNSNFQTGIKNPLDTAVLDFTKIPTHNYTKIDEIPFDFVRRRMSVVVEKDKSHLLITKGAPEDMMKFCTSYYSNGKKKVFDTKAKDSAIKYYHELSAKGFRVLAVAVKKLSTLKKSYSKNDECELELIGFMSFLDPPKEDVKEVLKELHEMGVEVKVITGDNEFVAKKICSDVGLEVKGILLGHEMVSMTDDALRSRVERTTIFARFSPDQKNRVINALKARGHVVGFMGDGINDAPSLKNSDVGISVNNAVDVARESADIVLTHKSLRVLRDGVLDGRKAFGNTMKYIMMGLSSNFGNMFSAAVAVIFLPFLPMLPVQILLNNFLYDFSQATIPTDNVDKEMMQKPKRWNLGFVKKFMYIIGPISSIFDLLTFFLFFVVFKTNAAMFQTGWFMESLATQTLIIHVIRTKKIPFLESSPSKLLLLSTIGVLTLGWIIPYTFIGSYFGFEALPLKYVLAIVGIVIVYLFMVEIVKRLFYRKYDF